jgi:hypothetical protein
MVKPERRLIALKSLNIYEHRRLPIGTFETICRRHRLELLGGCNPRVSVPDVAGHSNHVD